MNSITGVTFHLRWRSLSSERGIQSATPEKRVLGGFAWFDFVARIIASVVAMAHAGYVEVFRSRNSFYLREVLANDV